MTTDNTTTSGSAFRKTVDRYEIPSRLSDLAKRRTAGIASAWGRWGDYSLTMLCASCYLQGIEDANAAIAANAGLAETGSRS
jgi:hypothetical protein